MEVFEQHESAIRGYSRVYPVVFDTAENARQTDINGKQYIDFFAGAGVLNYGHNNPRMKQAMIHYLQSNGVTHSLDMASRAKGEFIQAFVDTVLKPRGMTHKLQFMGPTGTNSVEAALKIARRSTGRAEVVAFTKGFHGMTLGSLAATANTYFRNAAGVELANVTHLPFGCEKLCMGCNMGCGPAALDALGARYADPSSSFKPPAAFLVETIQAEGGVNVASKAWLQKLAALAHKVGALLIVDDIQVGCGRTGTFFSFDELGINPDVVCLAKGIGGMGTPMALNLVKPEHDKHWSPGEHTGTFRGQNLSFVAGREALRYYENSDLMNQVKHNAVLIREALEPLEKTLPNVQVRGKGMIVGLDVGNTDLSKAIVADCFEKGLIVASCGTGGRVLKVIPPLTIPEPDLRQGLSILVKCTQAALATTQGNAA
ncbi:MAG: aspartate aminotransferase family protein [Limnobacter sp.]|nr:aspartate aminotransferase family protein [Limnobacter sp.]